MVRQCLAPLLFLPLLIPTVSMAQRYGRPYSLAESPQILLLVKAEKNHHYFRPSDLRKMPRTAVTETDPATNTPHTYEGVALDQLLPGTVFSSPGEAIEIEFDSHRTLTLSTNDLDLQSKPIIADTVDGKPLTGDAPYCLVAKPRSKAVQKINEVQTITLKSAH
jgi:hypothetical protein